MQDTLIACVDNLKGFPEAISAEYSDTRIKLCIVNMLRNSLKYVTWKDYKAVTADLKRIYKTSTGEQALAELERLDKQSNGQSPHIATSWTIHWVKLCTLFDYPTEIHKAIYTTNAIAYLNRVIRYAVPHCKLFPSDESAMKIIYLAISQATRKWTMPIQNWHIALNRFTNPIRRTYSKVRSLIMS